MKNFVAEKTKKIWIALSFYLIFVLPLKEAFSLLSALNCWSETISLLLFLVTFVSIFSIPFFILYYFSYSRNYNSTLLLGTLILAQIFLKMFGSFLLDSLYNGYYLGLQICQYLLQLKNCNTLGYSLKHNTNFSSVFLLFIIWFFFSFIVFCQNIEIKKSRGMNSKHWEAIKSITTIKELRTFRKISLSRDSNLFVSPEFWDSFFLRRSQLSLFYKILFSLR